jgi:uncharacterized protein YdaU (DUF1376 family)
MAEFPAMPVYIDALTADCGHLSDAEFGLYMRLLFVMWRAPSGDGTIPNDDAWLAKRLKMTVAGVYSDLRPLIREFCQVRGARVTQRRLQRELEKCREYRKRQSDRAKSRWDKDKPPPRRNARHAMHPIRTGEYISEGSALSPRGQTVENVEKAAPAAPQPSPSPEPKPSEPLTPEQAIRAQLAPSSNLLAAMERRGWSRQ